jgi:general secretion pathway protein A
MDGSYTNYFGFAEEPFGSTSDPRFFYRHHSYQEILAVLQHGIESRKGIVVCTGEVGTGKTLLLKVLMQNLESKGRVILIANGCFSIDELLKLVLSRLGISALVEDRPAMLGQLAGALVGERKATAALLIDEAQDLSDQTLDDLRLLSNVEAEGGGQLLQMILMGQPELERKLDQPQLRPLKQRVALRRRLSPLARKEVGPYIRYRVQVAGYAGDKLFDPGALEKIALCSEGIPRVINTICDNALHKAYATGSKHVTLAIAEAVARDLEPSHSKDEPPAMDIAQADFQQESPWEISEPRETENTSSNSESWQSNMIRLVEPEDLATPDPRSNLKERRFNRERMAWLRRIAAPVGFLVMLGLGGLWYSQSEIDLSNLAPKIDLSKLATKFKGLANNWSPDWGNLETILQKKISVHVSSAFLHPNPEASAPAQKSKPDDTDVLAVKEVGAQKAGETGETRVSAVENGPVKAATTDQSKPQRSDSKPPSVNSTAERTEKEKSGGKKGEASARIFEVAGASYVRDKPSSEAEIIATLQPGTHVQVLAQTQDYFQVRSLEDRGIRGYVHREDAFFSRRK